jgi:hypothetical protein
MEAKRLSVIMLGQREAITVFSKRHKNYDHIKQLPMYGEK